MPRLGQSGNRRRKLPEETILLLDELIAALLLDEFIAADYEAIKQKPRFEVYAALVRACEAKGITVPSYKTFTWAVNVRPRQEQVEQRRGRRAAYQESPFYWELTMTTPRHGDRPFEIGHIDHAQFDVELVCSRTGRNLGRPWATFLTDAFSRRFLAVYLTFDPPSYRSCMMILRECVRHHRRLPQIVVVDGGSEFDSVYFETLLACYECTNKVPLRTKTLETTTPIDGTLPIDSIMHQQETGIDAKTWAPLSSNDCKTVALPEVYKTQLLATFDDSRSPVADEAGAAIDQPHRAVTEAPKRWPPRKLH
ncbi:MAG: hypothetical protein M0T85_05955 [Dehalococcoidales bacterium]|nr:hypothetical protein [Dehalococcoidales bacterium]